MEKFNQIQYVIGKDDLKEILSEIVDKRIDFIIDVWNETYRDEALISADKAAEMLDVSRPTLWRWEKLGYLIPMKIGGKLRYRLSDVKNIIKPKDSLD